jgi:penicillin-binding protein 1B
VKSYFLDSRQTLGRKVEEALMAIILDARFEKTDLMTAYINEIHLGQDGQRAIHGFGLASQYYFGKPLAELQLHEVALLVAVARGPSYYNPRRSAKRALERRNLVLELLAEYRARSAWPGTAGSPLATTRRSSTLSVARCVATIARRI